MKVKISENPCLSHKVIVWLHKIWGSAPFWTVI